MGNRVGNHADEFVNMDKVMKGLYVGGFLGANQKKIMQKMKVTHVLAIHDAAKVQWPNEFTYKCIPVTDLSSTDLSGYFSESIDFIHGCRLKKGVVYVHCAAGMSRSVTITVAYLMTVSTLSFDEALKVVQYCREIANPNLGFRTQLQRYQENHLLVERNRVLSQFPDTPSLQDEQALRELLVKAGHVNQDMHNLDDSSGKEHSST